MSQLKQLLDSLSTRQKISIAAAVLLIGGALFALRTWRHENDFKPLYTGLAAEDAAAVVQKLKESGAEYRLENNGSVVLVPSARLAEIRLLLAGSGLPKSGRIGFELFDKTNFGATDFTEHVNYRRALEGELERSILSLSEVESARVHITFPKDSVFTEARQPAKASVMVSLRNASSKLSPANVTAITHMVASAVEGLTPQAVAVVDRRGHLLTRQPRGPDEDGAASPDALLEYRQQVEQDLAAKIIRTLQPVLGPDRFQAGVSVDCDFTSSEQSEEVLDPARSVMLTSQRTEEVQQSAATAGIPGTSSNLPRPTTKASTSPSGLTRRTENMSYQSSRTVRHLKTPRGQLKRLSIAVLVDQDVRWEGQGAQARRVLVPPTPEKLKVIHDMVANVSGLNPERGDRITVDSLPFDATLNAPPPAAASPVSPGAPARPQGPAAWFSDWKEASRVGIGAIAVLLLLLFGFLLARRKPRTVVIDEAAAALPEGTPAAPALTGAAVTLPGSGSSTAHALHAGSGMEEDEMAFLRALNPVAEGSRKSEVLLKHLTEEVKKDAQSSAQALRGWLIEAAEE